MRKSITDNNNIQSQLTDYIEEFDKNKGIELGLSLCDVDRSVVNFKITNKSSLKIGKKLLKSIYFSDPEIDSALSYQYACLFYDNDYYSVIDMKNTALQLNNWKALNNVAYSLFKVNLIDEALKTQHSCVKSSCNNILAYYNYLIYDLIINKRKNKYTEKIESVLSFLISEEISDYESALILAAFFDNKEFVINNIDTLFRFYKLKNEVINILNKYTQNDKIPTLNQIIKYIEPKTAF